MVSTEKKLASVKPFPFLVEKSSVSASGDGVGGRGGDGKGGDGKGK